MLTACARCSVRHKHAEVCAFGCLALHHVCKCTFLTFRARQYDVSSDIYLWPLGVQKILSGSFCLRDEEGVDVSEEYVMSVDVANMDVSFEPLTPESAEQQQPSQPEHDEGIPGISMSPPSPVTIPHLQGACKHV